MDLFELLFIALFILFPILEQVFRKKREEGGEAPGPDELEPGADGREPASLEGRPPWETESQRESEPAAGMVPDDLWAILTGEAPAPSRTPAPTRTEESPWSDPESDGSYDDVGAAPDPVPAGLPEAYSLEPVDIEAVSLEADVPTSEARHRRFHEIIDREPPAVPRRRSAVGRALRSPAGVRQAFVMSEVLGRPKGLED